MSMYDVWAPRAEVLSRINQDKVRESLIRRGWRGAASLWSKDRPVADAQYAIADLYWFNLPMLGAADAHRRWLEVIDEVARCDNLRGQEVWVLLNEWLDPG